MGWERGEMLRAKWKDFDVKGEQHGPGLTLSKLDAMDMDALVEQARAFAAFL